MITKAKKHVAWYNHIKKHSVLFRMQEICDTISLGEMAGSKMDKQAYLKEIEEVIERVPG